MYLYKVLEIVAFENTFRPYHVLVVCLCFCISKHSIHKIFCKNQYCITSFHIWANSSTHKSVIWIKKALWLLSQSKQVSIPSLLAQWIISLLDKIKAPSGKLYNRTNYKGRPRRRNKRGTGRPKGTIYFDITLRFGKISLPGAPCRKG